jgi:hypothetical protein
VGDRIGAVVFNDTEITELRPERWQTNVMRILHQVLRMNHVLHTGSEVPPDASRLNLALEKNY